MAAKDIIITAGLDLADFSANLNALTTELNRTDKALYGDMFTHANETTVAMRNFGGQILNAAEAIPILGSGIKMVSIGFKEAIKDTNDFSFAVTTQAHSMDQLTAKLIKIEEVRANARSKDHGEKLAYEEISAATALNQVTKEAQTVLDKETDAINESNVAINERLRLTQMEIEKRARLAQFTQSVKSPVGTISGAAQKLIDIEAKRLENEYSLQEKSLKLSITRQTEERDLAEIVAQKGITVQDEYETEKAIQNALEGQITKARELYGEHALITAQLKLQLHQSELRQNQIQYDQKKLRDQSRFNADAAEAQIRQTTKLAEIAKIRAQYETQISDAMRKGNKEQAEQLRRMQGLAELEAGARELEKSPRERAKERQMLRRHNRKLREVAERDRIASENDARNGGDSHRVSNRDFRPADPNNEIGKYFSRRGMVQPGGASAAQGAALAKGFADAVAAGAISTMTIGALMPAT